MTLGESTMDVCEEAGAIPADLPKQVSRQTLHDFPLSMVLADPNREDCPIVFVNKAFASVTGHDPTAAIGRNCRFLQGEYTRDEDRAIVRAALDAGEEVTVDILNYRANGEPFINRLMITPLHDEAGQLLYFLGVQTQRTDYNSYAERAAQLDAQLSELQHRVKNHLAMILTMIRLELRHRSPEEVVDLLVRRIETLSVLYDEFAAASASQGRECIDLGAYLSRVASAVHGIDGKHDVVLNIDAQHMDIRFAAAAPVGLVVSEVITNAFQHAFAASGRGTIRVSVSREADHAVVRIADNGGGMDPDAWPRAESLGGRIVLNLVEQIDGHLSVESGERGTEVVLRVGGEHLIA